jgi:DNA-binding NarL/FixJ family response regulator
MPKYVLLIDDNPVIRDVVRRYLESESGIKVCGEAADGIDGVEKALTLLPDLIVMDLSMPGMNGLDAARKLKERMPHVPIVLFTSHKSVLQESDVRSAGISAIVSKSQSPETLKAEVLNLLERPRQFAARNVQ